MNIQNVLTGLLVGLTTGAILGVLYAPDKGSSTRKKISQKSDAYLNEMGEKFDELVDGVSRKSKNLRKEVELMTENGKKKIEETERRIIAGSK